MVQEALQSTFFSDYYDFFSKKKRTLIELSEIVPYHFLHVFAKNKKKIRHVDTIVPTLDRFFHARGSRGAFYPILLYVKLISHDIILKLKVLVRSHQQVKSRTKFKHNM